MVNASTCTGDGCRHNQDPSTEHSMSQSHANLELYQTSLVLNIRASTCNN